MSNLFFLIEWLALPLYIITGVLIIWYVYQLLKARNDMRATFFELERDLARRRQTTALMAIVLGVQFVVMVLGVQIRAVPFLETERDLDELVGLDVAQSNQDGVFVTDTPQPVGAAQLDIEEGTPLGGDSGLGFVPTPTLTPTPVGTIVPNPPAAEGCIDARAFLQIPANGMRVFQPTTVRGSAFVEDFSSAKLEIRGPSTNQQYVVVDTIVQSAPDLVELSEIVPGQFEPGLYQFRLTVFDITNALQATCMVNIYISAPPVTMTPTAAAGG
jgi:hypothetical protein